MPNVRLQNVTLSLALTLMIGWLLVIGKGILLPVFTAVISVYILNSSANSLHRRAVIGLLPIWALRLVVLLAFSAALLAMGLVISTTVDELLSAAPRYQVTLESLLGQVTTGFGFRTHPTWEEIRAATVERINMQALFRGLLSSLTSFGGSLFLVVVYAGFLFSERGSLWRKLQVIFPEKEAQRSITLIDDVNARVGDYLAVKTYINILLGLISYGIMWWFGVDFALFWAVIIGLLNYIPYVGSLAGVAFPVILSLAQFGSVATTIGLLVSLTAVQMFVGNVVEPRTIGRQLNLSPFVVLVALSVWTALWGIPGAILAIPMTSMITIICASIPATRFVAVLLADKPEDAATAATETMHE